MKKKLALCHTCRYFIANKKHVCLTCRQCKTICMCNKRAGIRGLVVPRAKSAGIGNSSIVLHSKRAIGLELELSDFGTWTVANKQIDRIPGGPTYTIDHDGSVKPSEMEAVIDPMAGDQDIINNLNAIARHVYDNNCQVNETCGYHVHVDARDFKWSDIHKLLILWVALERSPKLWILAGRNSTSHSQRWIDWWSMYIGGEISLNLKEFKRQIILALYGQDVYNYPNLFHEIRHSPNFLESKKLKVGKITPADYCPALNKHKEMKANRGWNRTVRSRYLDLNIHSWFFRGTVEYRLGAGTTDVLDIRMWPLLCLWLTEIASRTSMKLILEFIEKNNNPFKAIIEMKGFPIPSITGTKIYPMSYYLINWIESKIK